MRKILAVLLILSFIACGSSDKLPGGVLEKKKMQAVLWDILQADEFLKDYLLNKDTTLNDTLESIRMYERVFRFHKTSREVFDSSFNYYRTHPKLMKEVMDSLYAQTMKQAAPTPIFQDDQTVRPVKDSILKVDTAGRFPRIRKVLQPQ